eukprot:COSAG02_NODE_200_length_29507_cov_440.183487_17_plen_88_part_00
MNDANVERSSIVESESDLSRLKHRSGVSSGCVMTSFSDGICCWAQSLLLCGLCFSERCVPKQDLMVLEASLIGSKASDRQYRHCRGQ